MTQIKKSAEYFLIFIIIFLIIKVDGLSLSQEIAVMIFSMIAICLVCTDMQYGLLPDRFTVPLLIIGLFVSWHSIYINTYSSILGMAIGYSSLLVTNGLFFLIKKYDGIGGGDLKLMAACGAWVGWYSVLWILLLSSILGLIWCGMVFILQRRMLQTLPFGPFILFATWLILCHCFVANEIF